MSEPRLTTELDDLTRRFAAMPLVDQYEFAARVAGLLNLEQAVYDDESAKRKETLADLRAAMARLELSRPITKDEYAGVQQELGLAWSWQRIFRLWRSWEAPTRAAAGGSLQRSWQQRDLQRRFLKGKPARTHEEYLAALRLWLANDSPTTTAASYDQFAREQNLELGDDGRPLPRAATVVNVLGLRFSDLVAIARGETAYPDVVRERQAGTDWSRGPDDLVGLRTIGLMSGRSPAAARSLVASGAFPNPVIAIQGRRMWLRKEVARHLAGELVPHGQPNRLRQRYLTRSEAAELLAISPHTLRQVDSFPRHVAKVGREYLWLREEVEDYAGVHQREVERRRARQPRKKGRRSEFLTIASLSRELEMSDYQARRLVAEPAFPPPVRRFGGGAVWLRTAVEAYLAGKPLPPQDALSELLLDSGEVEELLAIAPAFKSRCQELPAPVARIHAANVYLGTDVEALLAADPVARARLAERQRRRAQEASSSSSQAITSSGEG